jgi:arsenite-transporting ATPase
MAFILTFLGKGGTGRSTIAIAAAKHLAQQGKRVLLAIQETGPVPELLLGEALGPDPHEVASHLQVVQFQSATLLARSWDELKRQEAQYLRTPFLKSVYGQELGVLPGMDTALALNAMREYNASDRYDVIVYDGLNDQTTLRMLGMPELLNWYLRRFRAVFDKSDFSSLVLPLLQPVLSTILNVNLSGDNANQQMTQAKNMLEQGQAAVGDPTRMAAYLVTTAAPVAIARAKYLWGSAQQIGLTVGGVLLNHPDATPPSTSAETLANQEFVPLPANMIPYRQGADWQPLMAAMPNFAHAIQAPRPITVNIQEQSVRLFLPGFDKKQVQLIQSGPEITIEAGDQRRNLFLPPELSNRSATGAKFQDGYLTILF